jgi:hypothetical protein
LSTEFLLGERGVRNATLAQNTVIGAAVGILVVAIVVLVAVYSGGGGGGGY